MLGLRPLYIILFCCVFTAQAQHVFKGTVVDALSSVSIPNAHVKLNDSYGVLSDQNGRFEISRLPSGTYLLEVADRYGVYVVNYPSSLRAWMD